MPLAYMRETGEPAFIHNGERNTDIEPAREYLVTRYRRWEKGWGLYFKEQIPGIKLSLKPPTAEPTT